MEKTEGALQVEGMGLDRHMALKEPPSLGQSRDVHRDWNKKKWCGRISDAVSAVEYLLK